MNQNRVTTLDKLGCAKRELALRRNVYPKWVEAGRMTERQAADQLRVMEAIVEDYREQAKREGSL